MSEPVGFVGLGRMGEPMAANLARAGVPLVVWNRSPASAGRLAELGATVAATPAEVFEQCRVALVMLANAEVTDRVLGRSGRAFAVPVEGRTVVGMGTVAPASSAALRHDLEAAGARYVEAPVSGSRVPAERGELVAMLAGAPDDLDRVEPLLAPLTSSVVRCGPVPRALELKLAVNTFLITTVAGLAETVRVAEAVGLDLDLLRAVLDAGQMASPVSRIKIAKLVADDHDPQAAVADVLYNARLIQDLAGSSGASVPLLDASAELLEETDRLGLGAADMAAVVEALRTRDGARKETR